MLATGRKGKGSSQSSTSPRPKSLLRGECLLPTRRDRKKELHANGNNLYCAAVMQCGSRSHKKGRQHVVTTNHPAQGALEEENTHNEVHSESILMSVCRVCEPAITGAST